MNHAFREIIEDCPVIATVKDMESLEKSFETDSQIIFILFGDICNISEIVERVKTEGRIAMVHLDLVSGFDGREIAVDFIRHNTSCLLYTSILSEVRISIPKNGGRKSTLQRV